MSTLFVCRKITIGRKDLLFPELGLSRAIVLLHCASRGGASSWILCCYWTTPLTWPSHLSAQPPPHTHTHQGRTRPQPKGFRNTSVHKQTLTWSLARKAFTLICNAKVVEPTNVCSVFREIPKIPRMKKNTARARGGAD